MTKKYAFKKGFTLAEVMIVLTVIGVLTAILLPVARQSMPDENLMKFKKAHNTLGTVIRELVTSDKYYLDGDLGKRPNGDLIDGTHDGDKTYLCETIADVLNVKRKNCSEIQNGIVDMSEYSPARLDILFKTQDEIKADLDYECKTYPQAGAEILLKDDVIMYQTSPAHTFGVAWKIVIPGDPAGEEFWRAKGWRLFGCFNPDGTCCFPTDNPHPIDVSYKIFCIDIDGIDSGEDPFGYGIRADGKILTGKRADEWLERDVNEE